MCFFFSQPMFLHVFLHTFLWDCFKGATNPIFMAIFARKNRWIPGEISEKFRANFWDHPQAIRASAWPSRTWVLAGELFSTMDLCWGMDYRLNFKSHSMTIREWVPDEGRKEYTLYTVYIWLYVCIMIWYVSICQNEMINHDRYNLHVCLPGSEQI